MTVPVKVTIKGIAPHIDGVYEEPLTLARALGLNGYEQELVKRVSGVVGSGYLQAILLKDGAFDAAIAAIVCQHAGKHVNEDIFLESRTLEVTYEWVQPEADPTSPADRRGTKKIGSGSASRRSSGSRAAGPRRTGGQSSDTPPESE